jgi:hypothetical protein
MRAMFKLRVSPYIALVLAAVMLLRGLIPVGFMPDVTALQHGKIDLVVCTGFGSKTVQVDLDSLNPHTNHSAVHHAHTICPFFGLTSVVLPVLLFGALFQLRPIRQRFTYQPQRLWFSYVNHAARPRAPPHSYFAA